MGGGFTLSFDRIQKDETQSYLGFYVPGLAQAGPVALDQTADPYLGGANPAYGRYRYYSSLPYPDYRTGPDASGTLILTRFDTVACIAAGTFSFTGRYAASGQTVQLTEGRFDVRFAKQ
ncbi:hypothetical protein [Hymenobacter jeollabukensis]|uniref:Uncharacterized protein n=1 Tax=Hymenobacter jeollabukensis TaxID=2025313 RepID=A0A5R8WTF8_9BACT|nr:hypothetical protein [Hymenobacter jeollabukensis]TLM95048.1 hypothetical protein FDY95_04405 [Hymenobacter jeollabukensis]